MVYLFVRVACGTMDLQPFFKALAHVDAIAFVLAIVWMLLWAHRNREKIRRS